MSFDYEKMCLNKAIEYGMPLDKVTSIYEFASKKAKMSMNGHAWKTAGAARYMSAMYSIMNNILAKYSAKMSKTSKERYTAKYTKIKAHLYGGLSEETNAIEKHRRREETLSLFPDDKTI